MSKMGVQIPDCNMCGEACGVPEFGHRLGLIQCAVSGGYDSTPGNGHGALDDLTVYEFSLCEFCLDWLFTRFRRPPRTWSYSDGKPETFRPAAERVRDDDWRRHKDEFFAESERRAALRKVGA